MNCMATSMNTTLPPPPSHFLFSTSPWLSLSSDKQVFLNLPHHIIIKNHLLYREGYLWLQHFIMPTKCAVSTGTRSCGWLPCREQCFLCLAILSINVHYTIPQREQSIGPTRRRRRFNSPVRQGIFLLESTFSADSLTMSVHPSSIRLH